MEPIRIEHKTGEERFIEGGGESGVRLLDFWGWAYSDCVTNTTRGALAEFLVGWALEIDLREPRNVWDKYDLTYQDRGIEVKSASYHQRWYQERMSSIQFNVGETKGWDYETNTWEAEAKRQAFVYVLCLLAEQIREKVNPLSVDQWVFWVVPTTFLDGRDESQKSITYGSLMREVGEPVRFGEIRREVDGLIDAAGGEGG